MIRIDASPGSVEASVRAETAGQLARPVPPVPPDTKSELACDRFAADVGLLLLPVVDDDGSVVGILNRFRFLERFATRFGRELASLKPVGTFMEAPLLLDENTPIDEIGRLLLTEENRYVFDGFVVTHRQRYVGIGTGFDVFRAFTARRHEELQHQANHDPLTGLPNRGVFERHLADSLSRHRGPTLCAVLFIDLDRFKEINDTYGHRFGDLVLCAIAGRLRGTLRHNDLVARLSGDEFAVILEGLNAADEAVRVAQLLVVSTAAPLIIDDNEVTISCSVGVALCPLHAATPERLTRAADAAMYRAKEIRNRWHLYVPDMEETRAPVFVSALRSALESRSLEVHYQPIVCLKTHRVTGVEALIRWTHPESGPVPASQIVKLAEDSGLVVALGSFVLETAVSELLEWDRMLGLTDLTLAVNVSALQVREGGLVPLLDRVVAETGCHPHRIELELTETSALRGSAAVDRTIHDLKARGFGLTLDDFGTGYSTLSRLERLPIDTVKIDRSFVQAIGTERRGGTIAHAIVAMGRSLELRVIGEGIETELQRTFLTSAGCHAAQGFLISRPLPAREMRSFLSSSCHHAHSA